MSYCPDEPVACLHTVNVSLIVTLWLLPDSHFVSVTKFQSLYVSVLVSDDPGHEVTRVTVREESSYETRTEHVV